MLGVLPRLRAPQPVEQGRAGIGAFLFAAYHSAALSRPASLLEALALPLPLSLIPVPRPSPTQFRDLMVEDMSKLKMGMPEDLDTFTSAVIDAPSFKKISSYIDLAQNDSSVKVHAGGKYDDRWVRDRSCWPWRKACVLETPDRT